MKYSIISLFPEAFASYFNESIINRAQENGLIEVDFINPREFANDKHSQVDDIPFGGGPGMVLKALPLINAVHAAMKNVQHEKVLIILFSPGGVQFSNEKARLYENSYDHIVMICGRYEGIDSRVQEILGDEYPDMDMVELSIGPYVLTGGEIAAMVVTDAISRHVDGVLGNSLSPEENRVSSHKMYTRPRSIEMNGKSYDVPHVLVSGNHREIEKWKTSQDS